jgi:hypothetical protein
MKKPFKFLILASILFVFSTSVPAQKPIRINFPKDETAINVWGYLGSYKDRKVFVLRVRRGQSLRIEQVETGNSPRYITVSVKSPTGEDVSDWNASCNSRKLIEQTRAGDYRITVFQCQKAPTWRGRFAFRITVK